MLTNAITAPVKLVGHRYSLLWDWLAPGRARKCSARFSVDGRRRRQARLAALEGNEQLEEDKTGELGPSHHYGW